MKLVTLVSRMEGQGSKLETLPRRGSSYFLCVAAFLCTVSFLRADQYSRTQPGNFSTTDWFDSTTNKQPSGPPGANDTALLGNFDVTASGGSVMTLQGSGSFTVTGNFTATNASGFTLKGAGTLNGTNSSTIKIDGGHLMTQNDNGALIDISNSGVETVTNLSANANGVVTSNGSLVINANVNNLNLGISSGGDLRAPAINNGPNVTLTINGAGSSAMILQDLSVTAGFLDLTGGGTLNVGNDLVLDGGALGGGGHWNDPGTIVNVANNMTVGDQQGEYGITIQNGAQAKAARVFVGFSSGSTGSITLSGGGSLLEAFRGVAIGDEGTGSVDLSTAAHLLLDPGTLFAVGFESGGHGTLSLTDANTLTDCRGALLSIGKDAGSNGMISAQSGARLAAGGADTFIGDSGSGTLSVSFGGQVSVTGGNAAFKFGIGNAANSNGVVTVSGAGSLLTTDAPLIVGVDGHGALQLSNGGMMQGNVVALGGGATANATAVVSGTGSVWNASSMFVGDNGGTAKLSIGGGGRLNVLSNGAAKFAIGNSVGAGGEVDIDGSASILVTETFFDGLDGAGTLKITNGGTLRTNNAALGGSPGSSGNALVTGTGSNWTADADLFIGGRPRAGTPISGGNSLLTVASGGSVTIPGALMILPPGRVVISGGSIGVGPNANPAPNTLRVAANGYLLGPSRIQGQVIIAPGAIIKSGNSPGIAAIDGNYQQEDGATFEAEIGGSTPGTGFDQISVTGTATLAGTLNLRLINGFTPAVGQQFRVVSAGSVSGGFTSVSQPSNATFSVTTDATGITATVTSVTAGAPVISSATTVIAVPGHPFSYQISASNNPTSFGATNLPNGFTIDHTTGILSGTPATTGVFPIVIAANNAAGSGQADLFLLVSKLSETPSLTNISTRLKVLTSNSVLIGGFIIGGTGTKEVLLRALGPTLTQFGVTGVLADPTLELHDGSGALITSNDNWKDTQQAAIAATGKAPPNDLESAILRPLNPGNYTAIVRGKNNTTGVGLVEAYDIDQAIDSTLTNISTRGFVDVGQNVMIGGFISGNGLAKVIIRALGPTLSQFGVTNVLADPMLELHDANGALIASNDNWKDTQQGEIQASGFAPPNALESAIITVPPAGNTTAIVRGKNNRTGNALVEVYVLP